MSLENVPRTLLFGSQNITKQKRNTNDRGSFCVCWVSTSYNTIERFAHLRTAHNSGVCLVSESISVLWNRLNKGFNDSYIINTDKTTLLLVMA